MRASLAQRGGIFLKLRVKSAVARPELIHKNQIHNARRFGEFQQGLAVAGREARLIVMQGDGREALNHLLELS